MKETFYLQHDYNSRNDEKVLRLRAKYSNGTGYAIYWMILEKLAESSEGRLKLEDIDVLAFELQMDSKWIADVILSYGLFEKDEVFFWSNRLLSDMEERNEKSKKSILANKIRWDKVRKEAKKNPNGIQPDIQMDSEMESKDRIGEDRKEEKNKKKKFGEYKHVLLSEEEVEKLKERFRDWEDKIKNLDEGIEMKCYKYTNHYLTILKWSKNDEKSKEASTLKIRQL